MTSTPINSPNPKGITREEFAVAYGLSTRTVDRMCKRGEVSWYRLGRQVRVMPLDEAQLCARRVK